MSVSTAPAVHSSPVSPWLSMKDAAAYLGCSRETLSRAVKDGRLKHGRVGSNLRFRVDDLDAFVLGAE